MASIVLSGRVAADPHAAAARGTGHAPGQARIAIGAWWAGCAVVALAALAWALAIAGGLRAPLLRPVQDPALAFGIDLLLLAGFALHFHLVQRPGAPLAGWLPASRAPRAAVALLQAAVLLLVAFGLWQPLPLAVWSVESPVAAGWLWTGYAMGWTLLLWGERDPEVIVAGICLVEWCVPGMSLGHLLFAIALSAFALKYRRALAALAAG